MPDAMAVHPGHEHAARELWLLSVLTAPGYLRPRYTLNRDFFVARVCDGERRLEQGGSIQNT